jgi:hypothetical protein
MQIMVILNFILSIITKVEYYKNDFLIVFQAVKKVHRKKI